MIEVNSLKKEYGENFLFKELSFNLLKNENLALVGKNGSGKSTLFKILNSEDEDFSGNFNILSKNIFYVNQDINIFLKKQNIENILFSDFLERNRKVFKFFDFSNFNHNLIIKNLSLGQKTKLALAYIYSKDPDIVFLDEPTNNLDFSAIENLKKNIKKNTKYINWRDEKKKEYYKKMNIYKNEIEKSKKIKEQARKFHQNSIKGVKKKLMDEKDHLIRSYKKQGFVNIKSRSGLLKKKTLEIKENAEKPEKEFETKFFTENVSFFENKPTLKIKNGNIGYERILVENIFIEIFFGDKIAIVGNNGEGKSTLLKTITREIPIFSGEIEVGKNIVFGNLIQDRSLVGDENLYNFFKLETGESDGIIFHYLKKAGISEEKIKKDIKYLSHGERTRALLSFFSLKKVNTLILDEPTNHLDIDGIFSLEEFVKDFKGSVILVSHNKYFLENCQIDRIYEVKDKKLKLI